MSKAELRNRQAADLRAVVGHDGLSLPSDHEAGPKERDPRFDNEYGRLAEKLFAGLVAKAEATGEERYIELIRKPNVQNGAYLLGSLLSWGPRAYGAYLGRGADMPETPVAELGAIMRRSGDTVRLFADTDAQSNHTLELNFGLLQFEPFIEPEPFLIAPNDDGQLVFGPSPRTLAYTRSEIMGRRLSGDMPAEPNRDDRCPAVGRVLTAAWNAGIDECVADPGLFEAGLATALAAGSAAEAH